MKKICLKALILFITVCFSMTSCETVKTAPVDSEQKPMLALTFDDGPSYDSSSERILDVLEKNGAKATFFMLGELAEAYPENVRRKAELGMELGNHTWDHNHIELEITADEIRKTSETIYDICGEYPTAFRAPQGKDTELMSEECKAEGLPLYYWTVDTLDWKTQNVDSICKSVLENASDGDIILMHEIFKTTADAVEIIVPELIKRGYKLVTCAELITAKTGKPPESGVEYARLAGN